MVKRKLLGLALSLSLAMGTMAGMSLPVNAANDAHVYRLYNPSSGEHLYTTDFHEAQVLYSKLWIPEGIGFVGGGDTPIYRVYNPRSGEHHYTAATNEVNTLLRYGWRTEGIAWHSPDAGVPVYRLFNPKAGRAMASHHYTIDSHEKDVLLLNGWKYEGVAWYSTYEPSRSESADVNATIMHNYTYNPYNPTYQYSNPNPQPKKERIDNRTEDEIAMAVIGAINRYRIANDENLASLKFSQELTDDAITRAMELKTAFLPTRPNGSEALMSDSAISENRARVNIYSVGDIAQEAVDFWTDLEVEKENILAGEATSVGVGVFIDNGEAFVCVQFGK